MKAIAFILLFTACHSAGMVSSDFKTLVITDDLLVVNLKPYTYVYSDRSTEKTVAEVAVANWTHKPKGPNFGVTDKINWVRYHFVNPSEANIQLIMFFPYHHINKIHIYQETGSGWVKHKSTGTFYPYDSKDISSRSYPVLIDFPSGESSLIIRFEHLNMPLRATNFLLKEYQTRKIIHQNETIVWFWRGIFLFALVISLVMYILSRITLFGYYFLLNIGVAMFIGMEVGDFFMFFSQDRFNLIIDIKHLGNILVVLFFPLFLNQLTPLQKLSPRIWHLMMTGIAIMPFLWLLCIIPPLKTTPLLYFTTLYYIYFTSIVFALQLYFLSLALLHHKSNALVLLLTYFFYITAVVVNVIMPNLGMKNENLLVYNTLMYGSVFEIFIFMIIVAKETLDINRERANLLEKQKAHQAEIISAIVQSQEIERNTVGRELHDMIGANLSVIRQHIDKSNKQLMSVIESTIKTVRSLSHVLVTPMIKDGDLKDEIIELCILFSSEKLKIQPYFHNWKTIEDMELATHIYRIAQELLHNAVKHSDASEVNIQFIVDNDGGKTIMYEDNGSGFDYARQRKSGRGIINIENRVKLINGTIRFDTMANGKGSTILIVI